MRRRRVLHVLPHAGAGAQTYVDVLAALDGYDFELFELTASRSWAAAAVNVIARQPMLVRAARRADLIHVHGEVASLLCLPLLATRPSVVTLHGLHLLRRLAPGVQRAAGRLGVGTIVTAASRTICVSFAERDELEWLPARLRSKLVVVRNGLASPVPPDCEIRARTRASLGLADASVVVLYAGQLERRKDPMTLVSAARRAHQQNPRIELLVAGEGPCSSELVARGGPETRLLGQRGDVTDLLAAADIFVMPSRREGLSYAVLEALANGQATVVSDGPGNLEAVGDAGLVFPVGDEHALAALLLGLAADPARRAQLGQAGRARIAGELSADQMVRGTAEVYEAIVTVPARGARARGA